LGNDLGLRARSSIPERNDKEKIVCGECNGSNLLRDKGSGEIVCQDCGLVISSTILDLGPEWRAFDFLERDERPRVGALSTWKIHDKGLSTTIGWQDKDALGRRLSPENSAQLYRLRKWQHRSKVANSKQRNLAQALSELSRISDKLNLPSSVVETSSILYRDTLKKQLSRGRTIKSILVACIYIACRQCGVIRSLEDIANVANISKREVARNFRLLIKELKPNIPKANLLGHIGKIVTNLALSGETEWLAVQILAEVSTLKLTIGRNPMGIAAACVYISSQLNAEYRTQGKLAGEADVTEVTIRKRYKELIRNLDFKVLV
jgi:transcription initiation factor TFIIB